MSIMKLFVRVFFKTIRLLLGPVLLLWEALSRPKGLVRAPALQAQVDQQCRGLVLYQYKTCPFCLKVRQEMRRLSLPVARLDAQPAGEHRERLLRDGGRAKVPCLQVTDAAGQSQWIYDSAHIVSYLRGQFANC